MAAVNWARTLSAGLRAQTRLQGCGRPMRRLRSTTTSPPEEATGKHVPFGEEGTGYYSLATRGCFDVIERATPLLLQATEQAIEAYKARNDERPFTIIDYGTADGGTSLPALCKVVDAVKAALPSTPVEVVYEDQITNDFRSVFYHAHGLITPAGSMHQSEELRSYTQKYEDVFVLASGSSFYNQVVSPETVDLGFSATAMHWLTDIPQPLRDCLHSACSTDATEIAAFREQARQDWLRIIENRRNELKVGGAFVCVNFAKDDDGQFLGTTAQTPSSMHHNFNNLWHAMADEGLITHKEWQATNFPNQYRSKDEIAENQVDGLRIVSLETAVVPCPYRASWLASLEAEESRDALEHAREFIPTTRTWSNSTFVAGLDATRSDEEKDELVEEMFTRYVNLVAENPADHGMDYVHTYSHYRRV